MMVLHVEREETSSVSIWQAIWGHYICRKYTRILIFQFSVTRRFNVWVSETEILPKEINVNIVGYEMGAKINCIQNGGNLEWRRPSFIRPSPACYWIGHGSAEITMMPLSLWSAAQDPSLTPLFATNRLQRSPQWLDHCSAISCHVVMWLQWITIENKSWPALGCGLKTPSVSPFFWKANVVK